MSIVLLGKYGVRHLSLSHGQLLFRLLQLVSDLDDRTLMQALAEVVATQGDLRARFNPKYRFDERLHDLKQCLLLDGYTVQDGKLVQVDPSIADAAPLEDELVVALQAPVYPERRRSSPRLPIRPRPFERHRQTTTLRWSTHAWRSRRWTPMLPRMSPRA